MARFDERASNPGRGPGDMLKWKVLRRSDPRPANFAELDAIRPGIRDGGAAALAAGDPTAVWIGHATWRNLKTLRMVDGPKVDVWTVRDGLAVHFLEMFDSYATARALGMIDWEGDR